MSDDTEPLNPMRKGRPFSGPAPPNPAQPSVMDDGQSQPGRYEVFSGKSVPVGAKPVVGHPRVADDDPTVFHQEDPNQTNRWLTPEAKGIKVVKKGDTK